MDFTSAVKSFFQKYGTFTGRSSRSEHWYAYLFLFMAVLGLGFIEGALGLAVLTTIFQVIIIVPSTAIVVRRLHDTNKSGWWYLLAFTIIGMIPVVYWLCQAGDEGVNSYGSNPLNS